MEIDRLPDLEAPTLIAAFQGWNDAGQGATTAVRYLIDTWHAKAFARMNADDYFVFTETRPTIRIVDGTSREMSWPSTQFHWRKNQPPVPDVVLLAGMEPNLRWAAFTGEIMDLARTLGARRIFTAGALLTDAVHTRPVPLTGFSTDPDVQEKFAARSITRSSYEGPTGIVGVLHDACRRAEMPAASIWAGTPYYLGGTPNPKTALGLLEALDDALGLSLNLTEMRSVVEEFEKQVSAAVPENPELQERIEMLERRYDEQPQEFPPAGTIIADLENFLRSQRDDG